VAVNHANEGEVTAMTADACAARALRGDRPCEAAPSRLNAFLWLLLALAAAALLRFVALGQKPLWCDELATLQRLSLTFIEHVRAMRGNHPLYELLLRFWAWPDSPDVWLRIPSATLGVIAVLLTWVLVRGVGRYEAVVAAWLMALSPLHVMYSRIARAYALAPVLALASNLALIRALKRHKVFPLVAYVLFTVLMVYSNLVAGSVWIAQVLFLLWFYRRRLRRLGRWIAAHAAVAALLAPWLIFNIRGAAQFGTETTYTARQLGVVAKVCYLPLTFCLGETVSPLNFVIVPLALIGFGAAITSGLLRTLCGRRRFAVFLLMQVFVIYLIALNFSAAAAKHLTVLLPAWCGLLAIGLARMKICWMRRVCAALILITTCASLGNYFTGSEFADADMVTPWRALAAKVTASERSDDALIIGYQMDRGAYDMFRRYYGGKLKPEYLDVKNWRKHLQSALRRAPRIWLLLHAGDPYSEIEGWMQESKVRWTMTPFQIEEETLRRIRERDFFGKDEKYRRPLYRLYRLRSPE